MCRSSAWHRRCTSVHRAQAGGRRGGAPRGGRMQGDRSSVTERTLLAALLAVCASVAIPAVSHVPPAPGTLSPPPYARFAGQTFEPSAAAFDPSTGRVLVLSDKDTTLYRYELGAAGLVLPPAERHYAFRLPEGVQAAKLEGLTRLPSGAFL